jgi:Mrp family chromosome partitioning ATPase
MAVQVNGEELMSRYSEWFDRGGPQVEFAASPASVDLHTGPRRPILPIQGRSRTEIEKVANRLYRGSKPATSNVVVFTALEPASGCSWVCAHSGDLLAASTDASVCLVDANLRTPTLHEQMGVPNQSGLADLITDPTRKISSVVSKLPGSELWLLTAGSASSEETECLLQSDRMRDRIAELRSSFEFVLIDAPAVSLCNDALALGQSADGMLLVLRAGSTRRDSAYRLTGELCASGVKLIGAILNDYASPIPEAIEKWL